MGVLAAVAAAAVLLAAAVVLVLTPWLPAVDGDPGAGLLPEEVSRGELVRAALRPPALGATTAGLATALLLVLTRRGRRVTAAAGHLLGRATGRGAASRRWQADLAAAAAAATVCLAVVAVQLPFGAWAESVRREAGLSTRSWPGWLRDSLVDAGFELGVVVLAVVALLRLARLLPRMWPYLAAAGAAALVTVGSAVYPLVVEPAFVDTEPLAEGPVRDSVLALARSEGLPVDDVLVADASRRTTAANAYVSGLGATRQVVLYDTLLTSLDSNEQVVAIVAHELAHVGARDVARGTAVGATGAAASTLVLALVLHSQRLQRRVGGSSPGHPALAGTVAAVLIVVPVLATPLTSLVSRQIERTADARAVELLDDGEALRGALQSMAVANATDPDPPGALHWWFGSHPTTAERVAAIQEWTAMRYGPGTGVAVVEVPSEGAPATRAPAPAPAPLTAPAPPTASMPERP